MESEKKKRHKRTYLQNRFSFFWEDAACSPGLRLRETR